MVNKIFLKHFLKFKFLLKGNSLVIVITIVIIVDYTVVCLVFFLLSVSLSSVQLLLLFLLMLLLFPMFVGIFSVVVIVICAIATVVLLFLLLFFFFLWGVCYIYLMAFSTFSDAIVIGIFIDRTVLMMEVVAVFDRVVMVSVFLQDKLISTNHRNSKWC